MTSLLLLPILTVADIEAIPANPAGRVRVRFDADWRFKKNPIDKLADGPGLPWVWHSAASAFDAPPVDETGWKPGTRRDVFNGRPGFAWFRTVLPAQPADARRVLHFEAVDDNADVWVNGKKLLHHEGWNEPFDVALKDVWHTDSDNIVHVLVENQGGGGGIQAPVNLRIPTGPVIATQSTRGYNDSGWRGVHLPHDYVVEGTFDPSADTGHGSLATPTAWYRKTFTLPKSYQGKSVWIDFDGVFRKSTVYLNGVKLGTHPSGYIGVRYDLTKALNYGGKNVLAVYVDPRQYEGWWYEGGGIYRHVWLNAAAPVHIETDSVVVRSTVSGHAADVKVTAELAGTPGKGDFLNVELVSPSGNTVGSKAIGLVGRKSQSVSFRLPQADLWSPEHPAIYKVRSSIVVAGLSKAVSTFNPATKSTFRPYKVWNSDQVTTTFGIRTTRWDKDQGFFLNGKPIKIKGTCNHLDHAGVGIAVPDSLQVWRLEQLKKIGCNAVRCSHNPPSIEFLDACDRLGILVMDETRHLGDTEMAKSSNNTKADDLSEFKAMLKRDRNHPSIILWSLANEEGIAGNADGRRIYAAMKKVTYELDGTRPVSAAMNSGYDSKVGFAGINDVIGINYSIGAYDRVHREFPDKPMMGSETASTVSTRGEYVNDPAKGYVSAYDVNYPGWAMTAEGAWKPLAERAFMAGGFVWTGFDYKGEPTPYGWPCINSHFGILDMCGFPKDNAWYYKSWWGDKPVAHILPHWNHPGEEGKAINVWVHSNAKSVELLLNGESLGTKEMLPNSHLEWSVPYAPGKLEAIGRTNGVVVARDLVETTGAPAAIRLRSDRMSILADGEDVSPINVEVVDAKGRVVPEASDLIKFTVSGGKVVGVGNGDASSHEPDKASQRHVFHGLCQALVGANAKGQVVVTATAPGLKTSMLVLTAK
jgi:beta-galactosidase